MTLNFPGPSVLRIFYTVEPGLLTPMEHTLQLNFEPDVTPSPGTLFANIAVNPRVVADHPLSTVCDELVAYLRPLFTAVDVTFDRAECWNVAPGTFDYTYVSTYDISLAATGVGSVQIASQNIYTFRSWEGGILRLYLQETETAPGLPLAYSDMGSGHQDLVDYFTSDSHSFFLARDTSYPVAFLRMLPGESEAIFKRRYRP